jgi:predicted transcriptional regulator
MLEAPGLVWSGFWGPGSERGVQICRPNEILSQSSWIERDHCIVSRFMKYSAMIDLDALDVRLLDLLQADASRANQALAEAAHASPATTLRRVRRLVEAGVIERRSPSSRRSRCRG